MPSSHGRPDWLRASVRLLLAGIFGILVVLLALGLWWRQAEVQKAGQSRAENLSLILADHLARTVGAIDTALAQLAVHGRRVGGPKAPAEAWTPVLTAAASGLSGIGSLSVVDDNGVITHSTIREIVGQSRRDLFSFRQLATGPHDSIVADTPFPTRTGRLLIPFGRRLTAPDGRFDGAVVATFEPERLRDFYRSVDVGREGIVWVLHPAGAVLFREPSRADPMGQSAENNAVLRQQRGGHPAGFLRGPPEPGEAPYLSAYRTIANPPLVVAVSLAERDVLADWRREMVIASGVVGIMGGLLLLSGMWINREISARAAADGRLVAQAEALTATVAERDDANAALRVNQARFQAIMDHTPLTVGVLDLDGRYIFVNRAFERLFGQPAANVLGKRLDQVVSPDIAAPFTADDPAVIDTKKPIQREITLPRPSGARTLLYVKFPILDGTGTVVAIGRIGADITEQKRAEAELAHVQKMDAVGQMTGGVAHDFNNLLTAILLNADVLVHRLPGSDPLRAVAQGTLEAAERGAALTSRLLAFSRRQLLEPQSTDVNKLVSGIEQLVRRTVGDHVDVALLLAQELWLATVDRGQLETAIVNLAANARDAIPEGGRLTVETGNVELDDTYAALNPDVAPGEYVMVAVGDNGTGMSADVVAHAFEPFFTTKEVGRGTGLGLSMVYGFAKQSAGHVKIYSEVGIGTVVRLYLPRSDAGDSETAASSAIVALPTGAETILFVEDDELVRAQTERQLGVLGYRVIAAVNAADAIARIREGLVPDLLFTDVVMPGGMNGRQLADRLCKELPGLKVLFTSGYTHGVMAVENAPIPPGQLLSKPFRRRDLAIKVREALDLVAGEAPSV
jgi:PAS domain S-box-containing protein